MQPLKPDRHSKQQAHRPKQHFWAETSSNRSFLQSLALQFEKNMAPNPSVNWGLAFFSHYLEGNQAAYREITYFCGR